MKTDRLYVRICPEDKILVREIADIKYKGNMSALLAHLIDGLRREEEWKRKEEQ